jgi:F-type H+/Na+-transporting ATPase subunit alpha
MAGELTTIARPYAEAAFEHAKESGQIDAWSEALTLLASVTSDPQMAAQIGNPTVPRERICDMLLDIGGSALAAGPANLVRLLADNARLVAIPEIARLFEERRVADRGVRHVLVRSAFEVEDDQRSALADSLAKRLGAQVDLTSRSTPPCSAGSKSAPATSSSTTPCAARSSNWPTLCNSELDTAMQLNPSEISDLIKQKIEKFELQTEARTEGTVVSVTDGIVRIHGLSDAQYYEMLEFPGNTYGLALNLERDSVGAVVLGDYTHLSEGDWVRCTGRVLEVPVGDGLLGRVVDALGNPLDGKGPIEAAGTSPIEKVAPGVIERKSVDQPLQTGLKAIDAMVPVGRGQRELIIGDRQTGKTAVAIDAIINQKGTGVKCIYVAVGQKNSSIAAIVRKLEEHGAMDHTIIVAAPAADSAAMQFLAPYAGCTMGEYFRDKGEDALIVYDDLTKQAWAYRQVSLLLRRPPGREAYPGDVFYLHSRLLERAARVNADYVEKMTDGQVKGQTGSLTALPIIETQAGDVSAFVPTNVISITDGQIFLETDLFNAGIRPAINAGLSVSRVGGAAQTKIIKKLGGGIRLALAQYRELAAFSQFASDLDEATRKQLQRGERVTELMKQFQYSPLSVGQMAVSLFAANEGYLDDVDVKKVVDFERALQSYMKSARSDLLAKIDSTGDFNDDIAQAMHTAIKDFKANNTW